MFSICFSSHPWVFIESYIYLMRNIIMKIMNVKIEFLSHALTNQMILPEPHLLEVVVVIKAVTFIFAAFCFVH